MRNFTATDGTKMTFELIKSFEGCQKFKIMVEGQKDRSVAFAGMNTEKNYRTLEILFAPGITYLENCS